MKKREKYQFNLNSELSFIHLIGPLSFLKKRYPNLRDNNLFGVKFSNKTFSSIKDKKLKIILIITYVEDITYFNNEVLKPGIFYDLYQEVISEI
ncbi:hypothetical protein [Mycoplasma leonicaptivi]|uniref:hypothetical protein n=1 Tax=Mycoplasma leonicaptivi TaxID=36742 RepID=UPI0012ECAC2D|nr:hypothetical protein [Mycoplasma leonicaptivi]